MSKKIIGATVGTSISPEALKEKLNIIPGSGGSIDLSGVVKSVNGESPDENGNVYFPILDYDLTDFAIIEDLEGYLLKEEAEQMLGEYVRKDELPNSGGNVDYVGVEPAEDDIPRFFYSGDLPQTKTDTVMPFRYISKTEDISGYCVTKAQGTSSMSYAKKNQTTKFYKDAACTEKMKVDFKRWGKQNKFCFKANWIDISHARNVVSARLWGDIVQSRANYAELPELLRTSPNHGAVDGFPVKVYANGVYQGRYTLNIPKDAWMANMDDELDAHCILCGEDYSSGCFRAVSTAGWSDEVHDSMPTAIANRWKEVITFVMNSTDDEFRANLGQYFDISSLIDYHIFGLAICGLDAYGKNQLYLTYDGQKWFASAYDMDSTWGLYWNGGSIVATDYPRTSYEDWKNAGGNLLYIRLEQLFWAELQSRWAELKNGALSIVNIINRFERFTDIAPAELVKEDYASTTGGGAFTGIPSKTTNNIQQIRSFALARQAWTDSYVAGLTPAIPVPCTGISLDKNTLTFTTEGKQTLIATVTPDGCTDPVFWESNNTSVATVDGGVVTAIANGNATITVRCGNYSASCSVAVSGIAESVPCTGIALNKSSLTFNGESTQTITATVTPSDTTDSMVWVSSAPAVASISVDGNVCTVRSISNGNAVITVTCGEHSATCEATVTGIEVAYRLAEPTTFNGTSDYIDTGVQLFDTDKDFTIYLDIIANSGNAGNATAFCSMREVSPYPGFNVRTDTMTHPTNRNKMVITHVAGENKLNYVAYAEAKIATGSKNITAGIFEQSVMLGCALNSSGGRQRYWSGTIYSCEIYNRVFTNDEMNAKMGIENVSVSAEWSETPKYSIGSGTDASGSNYVTPNMIDIPDETSSVTLSNIGTGEYTWLTVCEYDESGTFINRNENKAVTDPLTVALNAKTKKIRLSAYPNTSVCTDPANQIALTYERFVQ